MRVPYDSKTLNNYAVGSLLALGAPSQHAANVEHLQAITAYRAYLIRSPYSIQVIATYLHISDL